MSPTRRWLLRTYDFGWPKDWCGQRNHKTHGFGCCLTDTDSRYDKLSLFCMDWPSGNWDRTRVWSPQSMHAASSSNTSNRQDLLGSRASSPNSIWTVILRIGPSVQIRSSTTLSLVFAGSLYIFPRRICNLVNFRCHDCFRKKSWHTSLDAFTKPPHIKSILVSIYCCIFFSFPLTWRIEIFTASAPFTNKKNWGCMYVDKTRSDETSSCMLVTDSLNPGSLLQDVFQGTSAADAHYTNWSTY